MLGGSQALLRGHFIVGIRPEPNKKQGSTCDQAIHTILSHTRTHSLSYRKISLSYRKNYTDSSFLNYTAWSCKPNLLVYQPSGRTSVAASSSTKPSRENSKSPLPNISTTKTVKWSPRRVASVLTVRTMVSSTLRLLWDRLMGISTHRWWTRTHSHSHLSYQHETNHSKTLT